jgi:prolipoprotein diacylglyceryltransferase
MALAWLWWRAPDVGLVRRHVIVRVWALTLGALCCGRLGYVLVHRPYFTQNPGALVRIDEVGGLQGTGVWIGALGLGALWAAVTHRSFARLLRWLAPAGLCVAAAAWWGCAEVGCAWGREVLTPSAGASWLVTESPDIYRAVAPRYAVPGMAMGWAILAALLALTPHFAGAGSLALYLAGVAALTLLRADPMPSLPGVAPQVRVDTVVTAGLALVLALVAIRRGVYRANARTSRLS